MDSTTGAAAFTRRVLDLARRLAALGVPYPDPVLCCHLLEGLTSAFDTHKIAYMQLIDKRITPAEVAQWIITTEADLLRHSSSTAAVAQQRNTRGGRGGGRGAGRAHLSGASPAPSATGSVTPFPSSGFVGMGHYLQQVLERFDMARGTPQVTPLPVGHHLTPLTSPSSSSHPYAELIGSLMYAMVSTRPDLAYPISGGHLQLGKIDSAANLADIFTKALPHAAHSSLLRLLGLAPPVPSSAS
ncbi:hypothetical protein CLOP_g12499 [Closterium sp. NIES-67]|nr:hypothetical protein CLOP_g12499 [Closterium sp. NIES-67]